MGALEFALKHIYDPDLSKALVELVRWLSQLPDDAGTTALSNGLFTYLLKKGNTKDLQKVLTIEVQSLEEHRVKESAMTIADMLREEGAMEATKKAAKEAQEDREATMKKHVLGMLAEGSTLAFIIRVTGLSEAEIRAIEKAA